MGEPGDGVALTAARRVLDQVPLARPVRTRINQQSVINATPKQRHGRAEEIAEAVAWLCSDAASLVTGLSMSVDGGFVAQ